MKLFGGKESEMWPDTSGPFPFSGGPKDTSGELRMSEFGEV